MANIKKNNERKTRQQAIASGAYVFNRKDFKSKVLCLHIGYLELSMRARNCLENDKINWLGQLVQLTEKELIENPNLGKKTLDEIKQQLQSLELCLGMKVYSFPSAEKLSIIANKPEMDITNALPDLPMLDIEEQQVLIMRYGLDGGQTKTLKECAELLGIESYKVRQIEVDATNKLKHPRRIRNISVYLPAYGDKFKAYAFVVEQIYGLKIRV